MRQTEKPGRKKPATPDFQQLGAAFGAFVDCALQVLHETITPRALDDPQRMPAHRKLVRERLGMEIDCPTIASMASRWSADLREHSAVAASAAESMRALLLTQVEDRRALLAKSLPRVPGRSYVQIADDVAAAYGRAHRPLLSGGLDPLS